MAFDDEKRSIVLMKSFAFGNERSLSDLKEIEIGFEGGDKI